MYKIKCRICGETFISRRPQYTTCSIQCRKEAAKESHRKWYRINYQHRMCKKWCQKDSDVLQSMLEQGKKAIEAANCMGWHPGTIWKHINAEFPEYAVSARCRKQKNRKPWTTLDDEFLCELHSHGLKPRDISARMGRTVASVSCRITFLMLNEEDNGW